MKDTKIVFMIIREYFRKTTQTNFGKNQIQKILDDIELQYDTDNDDKK